MFKISEFSKIAQLPASQLRYYDKIGLFSPIHTDDLNQYRYYDAKQLPALSRILALKELGLTLEQISKLVQEDISAEEIRGMFTMRKVQIEQSLQAEAARLKVVEARLKHMERAQHYQHPDVVLKSLPAQPFFSNRSHYDTVAQASATMLNLVALEDSLPRRFGRRSSHLTVILHSEAFEVENLDIEFGFVYEQPLKESFEFSNGLRFEPSDLPAVETAACSMRIGGLENSCITYGELGSWMEKNKHQFRSPHREVMIVPPLAGNFQDAVVEVQFPVTYASPASS